MLDPWRASERTHPGRCPPHPRLNPTFGTQCGSAADAGDQKMPPLPALAWRSSGSQQLIEEAGVQAKSHVQLVEAIDGSDQQRDLHLLFLRKVLCERAVVLVGGTGLGDL